MAAWPSRWKGSRVENSGRTRPCRAVCRHRLHVFACRCGRFVDAHVCLGMRVHMHKCPHVFVYPCVCMSATRGSVFLCACIHTGVHACSRIVYSSVCACVAVRGAVRKTPGIRMSLPDTRESCVQSSPVHTSKCTICILKEDREALLVQMRLGGDECTEEAPHPKC